MNGNSGNNKRNLRPLVIFLLSFIVADVIVAIWIELLSPRIIEKTQNFSTGIVLAAGVIPLSLLILLQYRRARSQDSSETLSVNDKERNKLILSLGNRYKKRLEGKTDNEYSINLKYSYTTTGLNPEQLSYLDKNARDDADANSQADVNWLGTTFSDHKFLLILGDPGSGKTVTTLQLAIYLLKTAALAPDKPIPIIFSLSSWSDKYAKLEEWMEAVLVQLYGYPRKAAIDELKHGRIIPLFDGLDEVGKILTVEEEKNHLRKLCVTAIHDYKHEMSCPAFVLSSRIDEYLLVTDHGKSDFAPLVRAQVRIEPITIAEVRQNLNMLINRQDPDNTSVESARRLLGLFNNSGTIRQILCLPFYYNTAIRTLAYAKAIPANLLENAEAFKANLLALYITRRMNDDQLSKKYKSDDTQRRLTWLAKWLSQRPDDSFELSDLHPDLLKNRKNYTIATGIVTGFCFSLSLILWMSPVIEKSLAGISRVWLGLFAIIAWVYVIIRQLSKAGRMVAPPSMEKKWDWKALRNFHTWWESIYKGFGAGLLLGLIGWLGEDRSTGIGLFIFFCPLFLAVSLYSKIGPVAEPQTIKNSQRRKWEWKKLKKGNTWYTIITWGLINAGVMTASDFHSAFGVYADKTAYSFWTSFFVLIGILFQVTPDKEAIHFETKEIRRFRWKLVLSKKHWNNIALFCGFCGLLFGLIMSLISGFSINVAGGIFIGIFIGLFFGLLTTYQLFSSQFDTYLRIERPYQRLRADFTNHFVEIFFWTFILITAIWLSNMKSAWWIILPAILSTVTVIALCISFALSSLGRHLVLHYCLYREKTLPFRIVRFLNHCSEARILENEGGSWRFRHKILQDYFTK